MIYQASPSLPPEKVTTLLVKETPTAAPYKTSANPSYKTARHTVATPIPPETTLVAEFSSNGLDELSVEKNSGGERVGQNTVAKASPEVSNSEDSLTEELVKCISATAPAEIATSDKPSKKPEELPDLLTKQLVKCQKIKAPVKVASTNDATHTPSKNETSKVKEDSAALKQQPQPQAKNQTSETSRNFSRCISNFALN